MGNLLRFAIERTHRSVKHPARTITAPDAEFGQIRDLDKGLSDNRDRYIAQSAATRGGVVAPPPPAPEPFCLVPGLHAARQAIAQRAKHLGVNGKELQRANRAALDALRGGFSTAAAIALGNSQLTKRRNPLLRRL